MSPPRDATPEIPAGAETEVTADILASLNQRYDGLIRIPVETAQSVEMRFALLTARDHFNPAEWTSIPLHASYQYEGCFELDLNNLGLADGDYEYEFILDGRDEEPVADPFAEEIVRFGGYRGLFRIQNGKRWNWPFAWEDELPEGVGLANNHELVMYEMPLRWMSMPPGATAQLRQVGLGTFDKVIFEHLDKLEALGINAIELLPVQDSPDTLNWGYGTRFFFTPDIDMGSPVDLKFFIKCCHQRGIRVVLDVVMNHARDCPLEKLADTWFFLRDRSEEPGRGDDYGARLFRYRQDVPLGQHWAREFHYHMAEFWIRNYHIDGFRVDEFRGIDHWEFIQTFREHTHEIHQQCFANRPFTVIAEDSARRAEITKDRDTHPNGRKVVDAMWNFAFRDELRRLMRNEMHTQWGQPARRERIMAMITGRPMWDDYIGGYREGFDDMAQAVNYITSHDVEQQNERRFLNDVFSQILQQRNLGDGSVGNIRYLIDNIDTVGPDIQQAHRDALERVRSAFCLLFTAVGIPMILAGEEFADCHDLEHTDWRLKMSDPVDWRRMHQPGHNDIWSAVQELAMLRKSHPALLRNETEFFYFHPDIDRNDGARVFAYCRTGGQALGSDNQLVVIANCGPQHFNEFWLPFPWQYAERITESAIPPSGGMIRLDLANRQAKLSLAPFQVRVFRT
jgi:1,4-alpha-glucan branching enzyme